jgi:hypothetical protein
MHPQSNHRALGESSKGFLLEFKGQLERFPRVVVLTKMECCHSDCVIPRVNTMG